MEAYTLVMSYENCTLCPRQCNADRRNKFGFCRSGDTVRAARAALHMWEEPCISGGSGSGTVFFSGCVLKCCFCQNYKISAENYGKELSVSELADVFLRLAEEGADNINLVNPTHFLPSIIPALEIAKKKTSLPVIYNSGGYERTETIRELDGLIDVYLPDIKYFSSEISSEYSAAPDYFEYAMPAVREMFRQTGKIQLDESGLIQKGLIIRHLVLPTHRHDSFRVLDEIAKNFPADEIFISLMSQYTPFYKSCEHKEINRRISTFEYNSVCDHAVGLGLDGFMQERSSAKEEYTPEFDLTGL